MSSSGGATASHAPPTSGGQQQHALAPSSSSSGGAQPVVAYTPEEAAFHKAFPAVPLSEKVVEVYQCGLSKNKIVRMGKLYVTSLRCCFSSPFLKDEVNMEWDRVSTIDKKSNILFEAITVKGKGGESLFFSAFMYGATDSAHKLMSMLHSVRLKYSAKEEAVTAATAAASTATTSKADAPGDNGKGGGHEEDGQSAVKNSSTAASPTDYQAELPPFSESPVPPEGEEEQQDIQEQQQDADGGGLTKKETPTGGRPPAPEDGGADASPTCSPLAETQVAPTDTAKVQEDGDDDRTTEKKPQQLNGSTPNTSTPPLSGRSGGGGGQQENAGGPRSASPSASSVAPTPTLSPGAQPATPPVTNASVVSSNAPADRGVDLGPAAVSPLSNGDAFSPGGLTADHQPSSSSAVDTQDMRQPSASAPDAAEEASAAGTNTTPNASFAVAAAASTTSEGGLPTSGRGGTRKDSARSAAAATGRAPASANVCVADGSTSDLPSMAADVAGDGSFGGTTSTAKQQERGAAASTASEASTPPHGVAATTGGSHSKRHQSLVERIATPPLDAAGAGVGEDGDGSGGGGSSRRGQEPPSSQSPQPPGTPERHPVPSPGSPAPGAPSPSQAANKKRPSMTSTTAGGAAPQQHHRGSAAGGGGTGVDPIIRKSFPKVPQTETIVDQFQCSYISGVHRIGKMYVTPNYILFSSVMLGEGLAIKFADVVAVDKLQTMVILDGISITTNMKKTHEFTSFVSRESAYSIVLQFHHVHRDKMYRSAPTAQTTDVSPRAAAGTSSDGGAAVEKTRTMAPAVADSAAGEADAEAHTLDESVGGDTNATDIVDEACQLAASGKHRLHHHHRQHMGHKKAHRKKAAEREPPPKFFTTDTATAQYAAFPRVTGPEALNQYLTDYTTNLSNYDKFPAKQLIPDVDMPPGFGVIDVFKELFDDDTAFLDDYHEQRRDTDRQWEPWRKCTTGLASGGQRKLNCTTIVRAVFETACPFEEFQRYALLNVNGVNTLFLHVSGQASGVMYSDSFRAETLLVFEERKVSSQGLITTMRAYGYMQFFRNVWVKSKIIATGLNTEMPDCYRTMSAMAVERLSKKTPSGVGHVHDPSAVIESDTEEEYDEEHPEEGEAGAEEEVGGHKVVARRQSLRRSRSSSLIAAQQPQPVAAPPPPFPTAPAPVAAAAAPPTWDVLDGLLPRADTAAPGVSIAIQGAVALAIFWTLRGLWSCYWFDPYYGWGDAEGAAAVLSAADSDAAAAGSGSPGTSLSMQEYQAMLRAADLFAVVLRPLTMAVLYCIAAFLVILANKLWLS